MLRCPCEILKPFTHSAKQILILRYNSVLRSPFGCSCYHRNGVFWHTRNRQSHRKDLNFRKSPFKEQSNLFWTSFLFMRGSEKDRTDSKFADTKVESSKLNPKLTKIESSETSDVNQDRILLNDGVRNSVKISNVNDEAYTLKGTVHSVSNDERYFLQNEKQFENTLTSSNLKDENINLTGIEKGLEMQTKDSSEIAGSYKSKKLDKLVTEMVALSESSKTKTNSSIISDTTAESKSKEKVKQVISEFDSKKNLDKSGTKKISVDKISLEEKKEEEVKRQTHQINLGDVKNECLQTDPTSFKECLRHPSEDKPHKETSQSILLEKAKNILRKTAALTTQDSHRNVKIVNLGLAKGDIGMNTPTRRRQTVDLNRSSTERNFITPVRAMTDFLLKPSDLEGLRKTKRRSPYENDPPITVYWRKDVEAKALDVWGSKENLLKEILKRDIERRRYQQNLFTVKRRLRDYRREQGRETEVKLEQNGLFGSSGKVVLTAIGINGSNFLFKLFAWWYTGSHSMFSEAIHSLADTINQLILAYGIHKSVQRADSDHPYGYTNMRYVASLISGVGIFCVGSGLSCYHGFVGLTDPSDLPSFYWAYFILGGSLLSEGATLLVAFNSIRIGAKKSEMSFSEYVWRGQDPSVNVVLLEDLASVIGVSFAGCCMGLSSYYQTHIPDAIGSFLVGGLLAGVASFIIYTNVAALVGRSIPQERLDKINAELESDVMIRAIHDVKGIDIGNSLVRYKAEMDFDGGELTRSYLDKQDLNQMLEEVKKMKTIDELEEFMLKHGENIVDMMGGEIDRIELKLRKKHPEIRHCDLEIL